MHDRDQKSLLADIAHDAMIDRGLLPDFSPEVERQVASTTSAGAENDDASIRDMRTRLWCSIDNDDSRDLDQLTLAEDLGDNNVRIFVAVADVDTLVKKGSPIDDHARTNTTSVYTGARIFPMLPEQFSTDLTSLNEGVDRLAMIIEMTVGNDGAVSKSDVYRGRVYNHAQLAYNSVAAWLEGKGEMPPKIGKVAGLAENLQLQNRVAQQLRELRHENGALDLETIEARPVFRDGRIVDLQRDEKNSAKELIEDFMIAANGATARFLDAHHFSSIRRVVRSPERWDRIETIARDLGDHLPPDPDAGALEEFLKRRRKADPTRFPDLSLAIVKAMGAGEYVLERAGENPIGHFGLAVRDYTHSTAPNRRFPDLVTQRLVKAALKNEAAPYNDEELGEIAKHCTEAEDAANKVERQVRKSAAACVLADRIGERFDAIVTGASAKGTWVRIFHPPVEGKLVHGHDNLDIGDRVRVKLISVDIEPGFIDFVRTHG
jgi:exoribonuclease-2